MRLLERVREWLEYRRDRKRARRELRDMRQANIDHAEGERFRAGTNYGGGHGGGAGGGVGGG